MNLGDGLLFELENGKPKLILLSSGVAKNPAKLPCRPRAANILSSRQLICVDTLQGEEHSARPPAGRQRETRTKTGGAAAPLASNTVSLVGRNASLTSSKTHKTGNVKKLSKAKSDRHKHTTSVSSPRANGTTGQSQKRDTQGGGQRGLQDTGDTVLKDNVVSLAHEQLQQILNTVETNRNGQDHPGEHEENQGDLTNLHNEDDKGGGEEITTEGGGGPAASVSLQDTRFSGGLFSWLDERQSESRAAIDARKARWRRELDEQVALKQQRQRLAPSRVQEEDDAASMLSVQSSFSHREVPAAIRSSLRIGEVTPMEEVVNVKKKEEQRRRWLEELDKQRDETTERRRREKLLQSQTEDHEHWVSHFDSLQRRPVQFPPACAPPPPPQPPAPLGPSYGSDRGEWEPSSSLSLAWEGMSSCGADSICGASVDTASRYPTRTSYLRTMTALLDPTQIEERERRRLKQLEQQRAIEVQMEERRRQREQDEASRREEEEKEERRLVTERELLQRRYEEDTLRNKKKEQLSQLAKDTDKGDDDKTQEEIVEPKDTRQEECVEVGSSSSTHKDTGVQTERASLSTANRDQTLCVPTPYQPPPLSAAPSNRRNRALRHGKENICLPGGGGGGGGGGGAAAAGGGGEGGGQGGDPYEVFARMERSKRDKRRPEWNTQRPSRQFIPASERYPAPLQRNRQESRLKRQAELLALQERTCLSRSIPPAAPQHQEPRLCPSITQTRTSPTRTLESICRGRSSSAAINTERGPSPPVPAVRNRFQSLQAPPSASTPPPPPSPPVIDFIPYIRTDEVLNQDPLEPADGPSCHTHTEASPQSSVAPPAASHRDHLHPELFQNTHTHRQQEILRGLAQLRQGLLQKQRELEMDLHPLLKPCANNELR